MAGVQSGVTILQASATAGETVREVMELAGEGVSRVGDPEKRKRTSKAPVGISARSSDRVQSARAAARATAAAVQGERLQTGSSGSSSSASVSGPFAVSRLERDFATRLMHSIPVGDASDVEAAALAIEDQPDDVLWDLMVQNEPLPAADPGEEE